MGKSVFSHSNKYLCLQQVLFLFPHLLLHHFLVFVWSASLKKSITEPNNFCLPIHVFLYNILNYVVTQQVVLCDYDKRYLKQYNYNWQKSYDTWSYAAICVPGLSSLPRLLLVGGILSFLVLPETQQD